MPGRFLEQICILGRAGVDQIVLREKDLKESEYEQLAEKVLSICEGFPVTCSLHQNIRSARHLGAKSLHLSLPLAKKYQRDLEDFEWFGISTHSLEQLREAKEYGADYVFYGHVFATDCKKGMPPRGVCPSGNLQRGRDSSVRDWRNFTRKCVAGDRSWRCRCVCNVVGNAAG